MRTIARGLVCCAVLLFAACGGDSTAPESYNGTWTGPTSQNKAISFVIANNALTTVSASVHVTGTRCSFDMDATMNYSPPIPVAGNTFNLSGSMGPGTSYTASGSFSGNTATGNVSIQDSQCSGTTSITFTAHKN